MFSLSAAVGWLVCGSLHLSPGRPPFAPLRSASAAVYHLPLGELRLESGEAEEDQFILRRRLGDLGQPTWPWHLKTGDLKCGQDSNGGGAVVVCAGPRSATLTR